MPLLYIDPLPYALPPSLPPALFKSHQNLSRTLQLCTLNTCHAPSVPSYLWPQLQSSAATELLGQHHLIHLCAATNAGPPNSQTKVVLRKHRAGERPGSIHPCASDVLTGAEGRIITAWL